MPGSLGRGARRARGRPRVPDQGRRLQRGADPDLDRLQARERGRRRAAPAAPGGVLPLLRRVVELRELTARRLAGGRDAIYEEGIARRNATFETEAPSWKTGMGATRSRLVAEEGGEVSAGPRSRPVSERCATRSRRGQRLRRRRGPGPRRRPGAPRGAVRHGGAEASGRSRPGSFRRTRHRSRCTNAAASASSAYASGSDSTTASGGTSSSGTAIEGGLVIKVEAVVIRERVETVIDAVEDADRPRRRHRGRGDRPRTPARDHARVPGADLRVAVPAEGSPDLRRRRRDRRRRSSPRSPTRRAAATSRATGSSGRRRSETSRTTGRD